jgi:hypothetical protein
VDVYSFGIVLWVMWFGRRDPYEHVKTVAAGGPVLRQLHAYIAGGGRPCFAGGEAGGTGGGVAGGRGAGKGQGQGQGGGEGGGEGEVVGGRGGGDEGGSLSTAAAKNLVAGLARRCWAHDAADRPALDVVAAELLAAGGGDSAQSSLRGSLSVGGTPGSGSGSGSGSGGRLGGGLRNTGSFSGLGGTTATGGFPDGGLGGTTGPWLQTAAPVDSQFQTQDFPGAFGKAPHPPPQQQSRTQTAEPLEPLPVLPLVLGRHS